MTLAQMRAFVTVARHASVKGAAEELGVSQAAVSLAVGALRREIGDPLYVRNGHGVALTPGGRRFVGIATEILGLAHNARRIVSETRGERYLMYVVATSAVAEHVSAPLLDAFSEVNPDLDVAVQVEGATAFTELLTQRRADITLGPSPQPHPEIQAVPFMTYRVVLIAGVGHRLTGLQQIQPSRLAGERWLVGPDGIGPATPTGSYFQRYGLEPEDVRAYPSDAGAVAAAEAGEGIMLAVEHTILDALRRSRLVRLAARGTPLTGRWFASMLGGTRGLPAASALQRFVQTREASRTMFAPSSGVPAGRLRPPVHVTLWSSVASEVDRAARRSA
jgi:LysR family transcriptional regulator, low CO2-responsive transcriptional regulator